MGTHDLERPSEIPAGANFNASFSLK
jgi:hypothetical protein